MRVNTIVIKIVKPVNALLFNPYLQTFPTEVVDNIQNSERTPVIVTLQLSQLEIRMDKLEDAAIEQIIDKDGFNKRKQQLLMEKTRLQEEQLKHEKHRLTLTRVGQFLELLKSLAHSYKIAKPARKREFVQLFTSNRIVTGKDIQLEPVNWLLAAENALAVTIGEPHRHTSRRRSELRNQQLTEFIDCVCSDETIKAIGKIEQKFDII